MEQPSSLNLPSYYFAFENNWPNPVTPRNIFKSVLKSRNGDCNIYIFFNLHLLAPPPQVQILNSFYFEVYIPHPPIIKLHLSSLNLTELWELDIEKSFLFKKIALSHLSN